MVTGAPGTKAQVTNSGTSQHAVFNFVIPQGEPGSNGIPNLLVAYSVPPQPATQGQALVFDRNASQSGDSISHTNNSSSIQIKRPGYYSISFHAVVSVAGGAALPMSVLLYFSKNGTAVTAAGARHLFLSAQEVVTLSFSQIISVSEPAVFQMVCDGGTILYADTVLTVYRIGDLS
ncbi:MAG: hypothetical protein MSH10_05580 [Pygmaiobacter massiliensis]|nr:hypothetical protein [Pygmaiobacter massiliensis]